MACPPPADPISLDRAPLAEVAEGLGRAPRAEALSGRRQELQGEAQRRGRSRPGFTPRTARIWAISKRVTEGVARAELGGAEFDLIVIGGGVFGVCAAWDATLRGLKVALVEREDFGHAASANCFKMIHGGIRYLQHADITRLRQSAAERRTLLRIAPHLARPLPIFMPTYGHAMKGREILTAGMKVYDLLTLDRNRGIEDPTRQIPATRSLSRADALDLFPDLERAGLTGGCVFHDGQMHSPARVALSFLLSAVERGACVRNYTEAVRILESSGRAIGVEAVDRLSGDAIEIRGRVVLNATGGWAPGLLASSARRALEPALTFSRDACFVVRRRFPSDHALAVTGATSDPDAVFSRSARHLFLVPWRDCTLVGVWHVVYRDDPGKARVREEELASWIDEINTAYPPADLSLDDVSLAQCGLVLFGENEPGAKDLRYGKRSLLIDHETYEGCAGLITLVGVRFTTARLEAAGAVDLVFSKLGRASPACITDRHPIAGGDIDRRATELARLRRAHRSPLPDTALDALVTNFGSCATRVMALGDEDPTWLEPLPGTDTLGAEVVYAVRHELAVHLDDVAFRRTDLATGGSPGAAALGAAADLMARELGWDPERRRAELERVAGHFPTPS